MHVLVTGGAGYIGSHVVDIARAHLKCLNLMGTEDFPRSINIGSSRGYSVREVIECAKSILRSSITPVILERRAGDPAKLLANTSLMSAKLDFTPSCDLEEIIRSLNV
jgi:UDP-glucose 4-epimerase